MPEMGSSLKSGNHTGRKDKMPECRTCKNYMAAYDEHGLIDGECVAVDEEGNQTCIYEPTDEKKRAMEYEAKNLETTKYVVVEMCDGLVSDLSLYGTESDAQDRLMCLENRPGTEGSQIYRITGNNQAILL